MSERGRIFMVKKVLACLLLVVLWSSCAFGATWLYLSHRSIAGLTGGHSDYSDARFLNFLVAVTDYDTQATQEDVNLTGTMTLSGGNYSFWNGRNGGMRKISGTSHTFGLASSGMSAGNYLLWYQPFTTSGDEAIFCLSADNGLNGVNVSWNFPDNTSYNGQDTIPIHRTTQEQLESYVPYVEYISSGSQVTGLRWRMVNPSDTSKALSFDYSVDMCINSVRNASNNTLYSGEWKLIEAGNVIEGTETFSTPIDESEIFNIRIYFNPYEPDAAKNYLWYFCKALTPEPELYQECGFNTSMVNGKANYSNAKFDEIFFDIQANNVIAEAHHFTADASVTIPGGGYTLGDNNVEGDENTPGKELVTIPAGTDKTFKLRMHRRPAPGDSSITYQPIDENGVNLDFRRDAETSLPRRTITWTFPTEPNLSGSETISSFKSAAQQLAEGVPYIELVSADGKLTAVNFKIVTASNTSTAITPSYRTDFRIRFDRITSETTGINYRSSWFNNTSSGTWTLGIPQNLSNMRSITVNYRTWENPNKSIVYSWYFTPAEAPATLEITTTTLPSGTVNYSYSAVLEANISGARWSISSGSLPAGLTLSSSTGQITGVPTTSGDYTFTVRAVKDSQSAEKSFTVTISQNPPATITITTTSLPSGRVNTSYSAQLQASTAGATWSVSSGNLPAGLTLNSSTGAITGTPTAANTYTFTVKAAIGSASAEKSFTVTINPVTTLTITTETLDSGVRGQSYSATLVANISGASWSVISGTLPEGLTLSTSGRISGTPTEGGTYSFTVRAVSGSQSAEKELSIRIMSIGASSSSSGCESGLSVSALFLLALILKKR